MLRDFEDKENVMRPDNEVWQPRRFNRCHPSHSKCKYSSCASFPIILSLSLEGRGRGRGIHPALRIICKKIGFPPGKGIGIRHGPAAPARWPERTSATLPRVALFSSQLPEESRRGPDRPERFRFQISCHQADSPAGHDRTITGKGYP